MVSLEMASCAFASVAKFPKATRQKAPREQACARMERFFLGVMIRESAMGDLCHFAGLSCQLLMLTPRLGARAVTLMVLAPSLSFTRIGLDVSQNPLV